MNISRRPLLVGCLGLLAAACTTTPEDRSTLTAEAHTALDALYGSVPAARELGAQSAGVLVFPNITQAGLGIGGQYGRGVLFEGGAPTGFYNVTGGSIGLQIGAQSLSQAYMFTTPAALRTFHETQGFELGAGVDFAVADVGATGSVNTSNLQKPVVVWVWGQQGLMAGVKVEGQKVTRLEES